MINKVRAARIGLNTISYISQQKAGELAVDLFCWPQQGRSFTPADSAFLKTAKWESHTFNHEKIQCYIWEGTGKTVLLAHGYNSNTARWKHLVPHLLEAGYRVVALDAPCHGNSGWKRVNAILYAQTIAQLMPHFKPDFAIGHSFGGMALSYYLAELEAIPLERLVLMSVPAELTDIEKVFFKTLGTNERTHQAFIKVFEEQFNFKREYFSIAGYMKKIDIPGLVVHDENDEIAPFEGGKRIHENWKNSTFLATKKLGHSVEGAEVYQAILESLIS